MLPLGSDEKGKYESCLVHLPQYTKTDTDLDEQAWMDYDVQQSPFGELLLIAPK